MTIPNEDMSEHYPSSMEDGSHWSPPGSIRHPYRSLMKKTIFPRCHRVTMSPKGPETYTRSLSMLGHGIPLLNPLGMTTRRRKKKHLKTGINIGDVGYLDPDEGHFEYYFNIFSSATDDIQVHCPPNFEPLLPPAPENISKNEAYFSPGTALASKGVSIFRHAESPLWDIEFTIEARESGILLLPDGASREDLVSTDLVREFVRKNARAWYMFINKSSNPICPNGSLYVITGCDKTATYALATSSSKLLKYSETSPPTIRYRDGEWQGDDIYLVRIVTSDDYPHTDKCAVIIRGMQVALGGSEWINYVFRNEPPPRLSFYNMLNIPVTGFRARLQTMIEKRFDYEEKSSNGHSTYVIFNPSMVILKFLTRQCPTAQVAIVEDGIWCPLTEKTDGSIRQIVRILRKALEGHEISQEDGLVSLVPLQHKAQNAPQNPLLQRFNMIRPYFQAKRRHWSIARKLAQIFPAQGLPHNVLS